MPSALPHDRALRHPSEWNPALDAPYRVRLWLSIAVDGLFELVISDILFLADSLLFFPCLFEHRFHRSELLLLLFIKFLIFRLLGNTGLFRQSDRLLQFGERNCGIRRERNLSPDDFEHRLGLNGIQKPGTNV